MNTSHHYQVCLVRSESLVFVSPHSYPLTITTQISNSHPRGDVFEGRARWRFGSHHFSAVAFATSSKLAAVLAEARLVGELDALRGLTSSLAVKRAA